MATNTSQYPKRAPYFGVRVCRLLHKSTAAQEIGSLGALLVTFVALQEDACRYKKAVTFYDGQLMPVLGVSSQDTLTNARKKAVDAGWLIYKRGKKGTASTYWVAVPAHVSGLEDAPLSEDLERDFNPDAVEKIDRIRIESRSETDRNPIESRSEADASFLKPLPTPKENTHTVRNSDFAADAVDAITVPTGPYLDWVSAHRDFLLPWNDSPNTCHQSYVPAECEAMFRARWEDDDWRSRFSRAIARLGSSPFWSGKKCRMKQFLESGFVNDLLNGGYDGNTIRAANAGSDGRRAGRPLPSHITAGGRPVDPTADTPF